MKATYFTLRRVESGWVAAVHFSVPTIEQPDGEDIASSHVSRFWLWALVCSYWFTRRLATKVEETGEWESGMWF